MRRLLVIALIFSVGHGSTAFAAGPLLSSALGAARQVTEPLGDPPDAAEARRMARSLGQGRQVEVRLTTGATLRGRLEAIDENHFVLRLKREAGSLDVNYQNVQRVGPRLGTATKTVIWLAVIAVGSVWAYKTFSETRGTR